MYRFGRGRAADVGHADEENAGDHRRVPGQRGFSQGMANPVTDVAASVMTGTSREGWRIDAGEADVAVLEVPAALARSRRSTSTCDLVICPNRPGRLARADGRARRARSLVAAHRDKQPRRGRQPRVSLPLRGARRIGFAPPRPRAGAGLVRRQLLIEAENREATVLCLSHAAGRRDGQRQLRGDPRPHRRQDPRHRSERLCPGVANKEAGSPARWSGVATSAGDRSSARRARRLRRARRKPS